MQWAADGRHMGGRRAAYGRQILCCGETRRVRDLGTTVFPMGAGKDEVQLIHGGLPAMRGGTAESRVSTHSEVDSIVDKC